MVVHYLWCDHKLDKYGVNWVKSGNVKKKEKKKEVGGEEVGKLHHISVMTEIELHCCCGSGCGMLCHMICCCCYLYPADCCFLCFLAFGLVGFFLPETHFICYNVLTAFSFPFFFLY